MGDILALFKKQCGPGVQDCIQYVRNKWRFGCAGWLATLPELEIFFVEIWECGADSSARRLGMITAITLGASICHHSLDGHVLTVFAKSNAKHLGDGKNILVATTAHVHANYVVRGQVW